MAECRIHARVPRAAVFDVLVDPASYVIWVVGAQHIRGVDANWPEPGSRIHHAVGWEPSKDFDTTEVLQIDPPQRICLEARAWPFGTAEVEITLQEEAGGTALRLVETPRQGPAARFDNPVMRAALWARNLWSLRRLCRWAEERYRGTPGHPPEPAG